MTHNSNETIEVYNPDPYSAVRIITRNGRRTATLWFAAASPTGKVHLVYRNRPFMYRKTACGIDLDPIHDFRIDEPITCGNCKRLARQLGVMVAP